MGNGIILAEIDSGELQKNLVGDVEDSTLKGVMDLIRLYQAPSPVRKLIECSLSKKNMFPFPKVFNTVKHLNLGNFERQKFIESYLKQMDEVSVDIILCPAQLMPAPKPGVMGRFLPGIIPYVPWNVLDFPAGIAPITKWSFEDEEKMKTYSTEYEVQ